MPASAAPDHDDCWLGDIERRSKAHPLVIDVPFALLLAVIPGSLTISTMQHLQARTAWLVATGVAFAILHVSVALRRHALVFAYAMASVAMLVVVVAPNAHSTETPAGGVADVPMLFMPSSLVFLLLLYTAATDPRPLRGLALVTALIGAVPATIRSADPLAQVYPGRWWVWGYVAASLVLIVAATWTLGSFRLIRQRRDEAEQAEATRLAVMDERSRIARDMHDIVAHSLAVIVRQAEGGAFAAARAPDQAVQALRVIADTGRDALNDMRGLLGVLRGHDGEIATAPQPSLPDLPGLLDRVRETGLDVECVQRGTEFTVSTATGLAAYRVVQESLTNALKYAGPQARIRVLLEWSGDDLAVDVTDDGGNGDRRTGAPDANGARPNGARPDGSRSVPVSGAGAGLQGLRDRVAAVGGSFTAHRLDTGFQVRATFPRRLPGGSR